MIILVMNIAMPVFAIETVYSIQVKNNASVTGTTINGNKYEAYKLFDVTYGKNPDGTTPNGAYAYTVAPEFKDFIYQKHQGQDLVDYVATLKDHGTELNQFAKEALEYIKIHGIKAAGTAIAEGETANIPVQEPGYYLIAGTATAPDQQTMTAACALDTTNPVANIEVKTEAPKIDKVILQADSAVSETGEGNGTAVNVGDSVTFQLTSKVPNMTGYTTYAYEVHDTMTDGLTFQNNIKVTIGNKELVQGNDYTIEIPEATGETFVVKMDLKGLEQSGKAMAGEKIQITYSALLNEKALRKEHETNQVHLEYSNNPYDDSTKGKTPEETVYVYNFDIIIDKYVEEQKTEKLAGAQFVLYRISKNSKKEYYKWNEADQKTEWVTDFQQATKKITDRKGKIAFTGLDTGEYYLEETKAPDGYNKLASPIKINITAEYQPDGTIKEVVYTVDGDPLVVIPDGCTHIGQRVGVANSTGKELPSTGGMGTTIFYTIGTILMSAAIILMIRKKKLIVWRKNDK